MMVLPPAWSKAFSNEEKAFSFFFNQAGQVFRQHKNRKTIRFYYEDHPYFLKIHQSVGWAEIIKNGLSFKKPVLGAYQEWAALKQLHALQIPSLEAVAWGEQGCNPATKRSFLVTREIAPHIDLATLFKQWEKDPSKIKLRRCLIQKMASIAKKMHEQGINHRDFYLCHFIIKTDQTIDEHTTVYLIDLHRAQIRSNVPMRWRLKDLSGLLFSAMEINLSMRDCFRFLKFYCGEKKLKNISYKDRKFWKKVYKKANKLHCKIYDDDKKTVTHKLSYHKVVYLKKDETDDLLAFLQNIESYFYDKAVKYLKKGDTTTVILVCIGDKQWVVKRYNLLNRWVRLKRLFAPSRAKRCWQMSHDLQKMNVNTPAPIAYVERKYGPFRQEAYFISEFVSGMHAQDYFKDKKRDQKEMEVIARKITSAINKMFSENITHGDMKATNILLSDDKIYFIDLDAMKRHDSFYGFQRAKRKDVKRFMKNWQHDEAVSKLFSNVIFMN